ncbi:hypothetical protein FRC03_004711 [Tulasnella sp. 419]|nr:hypothetical protein FRC03_004711 [Tulasnella sp. 419]
MPHRSLESVWWPFVQHGLLGDGRDITVIDSAHNDTFETFSHHLGKKLNTSHLVPLFDGSASWWTQSLGHANPDLTLAAAYAAGRYGHVIFPQAIHGPALELTERLLRGPGKGWASRVFFSDNGSTGMEVALKMAVRATSLRYGNPGSKELGVIGLKGSYHGDTIGAMDACESGVFNAAVEWHRERGFWFDVPTVGVRGGRVVVSTEALGLRETAKAEEFDSISQVYDIRRRLQQPLAQEYRRYIQSTLEQQVAQGHAFGALVIEPLLMGAGGMIFVDPLFHRVLVDVVRMSEDLFLKALDGGKREKKSPIDVASAWRGLPVVFDEVFVGLYRLGLQTSAPLLGVNPDILVLAKILTGGLLPLSATLASQSIFDAFYGKQKMDALLHGHSYTAYPVGCAVANESVNSLERISHSGSWNTAKKQWDAIPSEKDMDGQRVWSFWNPQFLLDISMLDSVEATMALGTVLAIHLRDQSAGYQSITGQNLLSPLLNTFGDESSAFGVHYRTLGNVIYLMSSLNTPQAIFSLLENRLSEILQRCSKG